MTAPGMADGALDPEQAPKLQRELEEAQETLRAIRQGEVDALVVESPHGAQLFTLKSAEQPYRMLVELHSGIPATKTATQEQQRLLARIQKELTAQGIDFLTATSSGATSS